MGGAQIPACAGQSGGGCAGSCLRRNDGRGDRGVGESGWWWLAASHPPPNLPLKGGRDELGKRMGVGVGVGMSAGGRLGWQGVGRSCAVPTCAGRNPGGLPDPARLAIPTVYQRRVTCGQPPAHATVSPCIRAIHGTRLRDDPNPLPSWRTSTLSSSRGSRRADARRP